MRFVDITAENVVHKLRRNGISPTRWCEEEADQLKHGRVVYAFPVLPSYTLTYSCSRELKRWGRTALSAVAFKLPDQEMVYVRHCTDVPLLKPASEVAGLILHMEDNRGYEVAIPRRIQLRDIEKIRSLPKAIGWRYWPKAKETQTDLCDCTVCMRYGEVIANQYRQRMVRRMIAAGLALYE